MADENWYWLGTNPIGRRERTIVLPHAVVDTGLLETESEVVWGRDSVYDAVTISGRGEAFEDDRYERLGDSTVGDEPVLAIPNRVMETTGFEPSESIHFATTDELGRAGCCLCLSSDEADELLEDARAMSGSVNSGRVRGDP